MSKELYEKVKEFILNYQPRKIVYPGVIKRRFKLDLQEVYLLMENLAEKGIVIPAVETFCPNCMKSTGKVFTSICDIPAYDECQYCGMEIETPLESNIVVYIKC